MNKSFLFAILLTLAACQSKPQPQAIAPSPSPTPSASISPATPTPSASPSPNEAFYPIKQEFEFTDASVTVNRVLVGEDAVLIDYTVKNTSSSVVSIYPDQGSVMVGDRQFDANPTATDGDVSGELQPGATKQGIVTYPVKGDRLVPADVRQLKVAIGSIISSPSYEKEEVSITLSLK